MRSPATRRLVLASVTAWLAGVLVVQPASPQPSLQELLQRAGSYVRQLEDDFSAVISDEQYEQKVMLRNRRALRRMASEMSFTWMPEAMMWLSVRDVLRVDGAAVADSRARLDSAMTDRTPGRTSQLLRLRDEGARFNIGRIGRNFSDPMLGLQVIDPNRQQRFEFGVAGRDRVRGVDTVQLTFAEQAHPTLIVRGTDGQDLPTHGDIWIGAADGVVRQTRLITDDSKSGTRATIAVTFGHDPKLDRWLPVRMDETYTQLSVMGGLSNPTRGVILERVDCVALYANYRRFETSGRLLTQ